MGVLLRGWRGRVREGLGRRKGEKRRERRRRGGRDEDYRKGKWRDLPDQCQTTSYTPVDYSYHHHFPIPNHHHQMLFWHIRFCDFLHLAFLRLLQISILLPRDHTNYDLKTSSFSSTEMCKYPTFAVSEHVACLFDFFQTRQFLTIPRLTIKLLSKHGMIY